MRLPVLAFALATLLLAASAAALTRPPAPTPAADTPPTAEDIRFFESRIRPLLLQRCGGCHGAEKQTAGLRLDARASILKGGGRGPAIIAGEPESSLLVRAVRQQGSPKMPPDGRLTDLEVADLERWVRLGAPWPVGERNGRVGGTRESGRAPFRAAKNGRSGTLSSGVPAPPGSPPRRGPRPATGPRGGGSEGWGVRAGAHEVGGGGSPLVHSSAQAHWAFIPVRRSAIPAVRNRSWVRTPVDAFILAKLEAKGLEPSPPAERRTLIRRATFDLLGLPPTPEEVEAFVADRAPDAWAKVIHRLLASPHYGERWGRHWLDVARYADSNGMDENVHYGNAWRYRDYVVKAFNDDKPYDRFIIEQLAGDLLAEAGLHDAVAARAATSVARGGSRGAGEQGEANAREQRSRGAGAGGTSALPQVGPTAGPSEVLPGSVALARHEALIATGFLSIGPKVISEVDDRKMEMDMVDEQVDSVGRTFMGLTLGCARCHDHKFDPVSTEDYYGLAGIFKSTKTMEVMKKPRMWHEHSLADEGDLTRKRAHDERIVAHKALTAKAIADATERLKASLPAGAAPPKHPETQFPDPAKAELKRLRDELTTMEKEAPVMPACMGVTEGAVGDLPVHVRGSFLELGRVVPRRFPAVLSGTEQPLFEPGRSGRLRLAQWLASPEHPLTSRVMVNRVWRGHFGRGLVPTPDNFGLQGERPTHPELLEYLAWHFARGSDDVRTYGRGEVVDSTTPSSTRPHIHASTPSAPRPWSLKSLHRLLMLSSTYQQSATPNPKSRARNPQSVHPLRGYPRNPQSADPDSRLYSRWIPRRLEAEAIRDSLLAVSERLDRAMGGTLIPLKNREYFFDHTSRDQTKYDSRRRTLYLPVVRNHLYDALQLFDFGDAQVPEGNRSTTTVAPQALFMLNSDVVLDAAATLAEEVLERADLDDDGRVRILYLKAYARPPSAAELAGARALLGRLQAEARASAPDATGARPKAWAWFCQTLLMANEFVYVA